MIDIKKEPLEELEEDYKIFKDAAERLEKRYDLISKEIIHRLKINYVDHIGSEINHRKRMARIKG